MELDGKQRAQADFKEQGITMQIVFHNVINTKLPFGLNKKSGKNNWVTTKGAYTLMLNRLLAHQ